MKLFASDLDGTLLNAQHKGDWIINAGLKKIQDNGDIFTICTGRNLSMAKMAGLIDSYLICMNGACIFDRKDNLISGHPLSKEALKILLNETPFQFEYQTIDSIYTTKDASSFREVYIKNQRMRNRPISKDIDQFLKRYTFDCDPDWILGQTIYKANFHYTDPYGGQQMDELAKKYSDLIVNAPSVTSLAEITDANVNKGNAVKELASHLKISEEDVFVYGDGINDLTMLKAFANSYCPSTGTQPALETAHHTVGRFQEYSVIRHMVEISGRKERGK